MRGEEYARATPIHSTVGMMYTEYQGRREPDFYPCGMDLITCHDQIRFVTVLCVGRNKEEMILIVQYLNLYFIIQYWMSPSLCHVMMAPLASLLPKEGMKKWNPKPCGTLVETTLSLSTLPHLSNREIPVSFWVNERTKWDGVCIHVQPLSIHEEICVVFTHVHFSGARAMCVIGIIFLD